MACPEANLTLRLSKILQLLILYVRHCQFNLNLPQKVMNNTLIHNTINSLTEVNNFKKLKHKTDFNFMLLCKIFVKYKNNYCTLSDSCNGTLET